MDQHRSENDAVPRHDRKSFMGEPRDEKNHTEKYTERTCTAQGEGTGNTHTGMTLTQSGDKDKGCKTWNTRTAPSEGYLPTDSSEGGIKPKGM